MEDTRGIYLWVLFAPSSSYEGVAGTFFLDQRVIGVFRQRLWCTAAMHLGLETQSLYLAFIKGSVAGVV